MMQNAHVVRVMIVMLVSFAVLMLMVSGLTEAVIMSLPFLLMLGVLLAFKKI